MLTFAGILISVTNHSDPSRGQDPATRGIMSELRTLPRQRREKTLHCGALELSAAW